MSAARTALHVAALFSAIIAAPVAGQTKFEFTPNAGFYIPLRPIVDEASWGGVGMLKKRQVGSMIFGARAAVQAAQHWWLESSLTFSPSLTAVSTSERTFDQVGGLVIGSARAIWRTKTTGQSPTQKYPTPSVQLAAGVAMINRFGAAWREHTGTTDPALLVGAGIRMPLGAIMPMNVRFEVENYISRGQFGHDDGATTSALVIHDLMFSVGFEIPMTRGGKP